MYLDGYSDCLTSFCEPPYRHHTGLKNVYGNHIKIVWGSNWFGTVGHQRGFVVGLLGWGGGLKVVPGYVTKDSWVGGGGLGGFWKLYLDMSPRAVGLLGGGGGVWKLYLDMHQGQLGGGGSESCTWICHQGQLGWVGGGGGGGGVWKLYLDMSPWTVGLVGIEEFLTCHRWWCCVGYFDLVLWDIRGFLLLVCQGGGGGVPENGAWIPHQGQSVGGCGKVFDTSQMMMSAVTWAGWKYHNLVCSCLVVCCRWMTWCATNWWGKMAHCHCGQNAWLVEW